MQQPINSGQHATSLDISGLEQMSSKPNFMGRGASNQLIGIDNYVSSSGTRSKDRSAGGGNFELRRKSQPNPR